MFYITLITVLVFIGIFFTKERLFNKIFSLVFLALFFMSIMFANKVTHYVYKQHENIYRDTSSPFWTEAWEHKQYIDGIVESGAELWFGQGICYLWAYDEYFKENN